MTEKLCCKSLLLVYWLLCLSCRPVTSTDASNGVNEETVLLQKLNNVLPKYHPPHDMQNNTVYIYVDLYQILDVDEKNGVLSAKLWLYFYYYTPSALWDPNDYNGTQGLLVPANTFWTADIGEPSIRSHLTHPFRSMASETGQ